jgi:hypothetical protein
MKPLVIKNSLITMAAEIEPATFLILKSCPIGPAKLSMDEKVTFMATSCALQNNAVQARGGNSPCPVCP